MKKRHWIGVLAAISLMAFSVGAVSAQEGPERTRKGFVGTVSSYDEGAGLLVLLIKGDQAETSTPVTLTIGPDVVIKVPGRPGVTQGTLEEGARVAVLAQMTEGGDWEAIQVVVKPVKPTRPPVTGAVTSIEGRTLTITRRDGTTKTIQLGAGDTAPSVGEVVTAFAPRGRGEDGGEDVDGPPVATGLVRAAEVHERLNRHLQRAVDDPDVPEQARGRLVADIATALDNFSARRITVLETVRARAPQAARRGLDNALDNARRGRGQSLEKANEARAKAGPPEGRGRRGGQGEGEDEECPTDGQGEGEECPEAEDDEGRPGRGNGQSQGRGNGRG